MPNPTPTPAGMTAEQQETLQQFLERLVGYRGQEVNGNYLAREAAEQLARLSGMAAATAWQPMETAPRDRPILVRSPSRGIFEGKWSEWLGYFLAARICGLGLPDADGWCEIPAAPEVPGHG